MATVFQTSCTDCPFSGTYTSQAGANRAFRLHSCERQRHRAGSAARRAARWAAVDRTPKPCLHRKANHQHGTYACYVLDYCRCGSCSKANADYEANRVRQQAYGRWNGYIDAEPARQHIRSLTEQGMGLKRIVAVSDISQGLLWKLMYGKKRPDGTRTPSKRIRPDTAARILAVKLDLADGAKVDGDGAVRRIQALIALGWSQSKICRELDITPANFTPIVHGRRLGMTVAHDKAVRALYDRWSMKLPPEDNHRDKIAASRARRYAKTYGWLPPLAWDDDALDNPDADAFRGEAEAAAKETEIDEAAIYRRMRGDRTVRLSKADAAELVTRCLAANWSQIEIERRTGVHPQRHTTSQQEAS